jgi:hypothetical protein
MRESSPRLRLSFVAWQETVRVVGGTDLDLGRCALQPKVIKEIGEVGPAL